MRLIYIDIETGGLEHWRHTFNGNTIPMKPITQIAALATEEDQILETFECKVKFQESSCSPKALEINSYNRELWQKEAIHPTEAIQQLNDFMRPHSEVSRVSSKGKPYKVARLAGHNIAKFDFPFLSSYYRYFQQFFPADYHTYDTMTIAIMYQMLTNEYFENLKLETLAKHFNIAHDAHDALGDVAATFEVNKAIIENSFTFKQAVQK